MSNLPAFGAYAAAFGESLLDDDWSRLERFFSSDAAYLPGDTVTLKFKARYRKEGLPDLILSGYETVEFSDGLIRKMEDVFDAPSALFDWRDKL